MDTLLNQTIGSNTPFNRGKSFKTGGLRGRLILWINLFTVILVATIVAIWVIQVKNEITRATEERSAELAQVLAMAGIAPVISYDFASLSRYAEETVREGEGRVVYITFLDPQGKVLAHSDPKINGQTFEDEATRKVLGTDKPLTQYLEGGLIDSSAPLISEGQKFGYVRVGLSLDQTRHSVVEAQKLGFFAALGAILIGISMSLFLANTIAKPVKRLLEGTRTIAAGNLNLQVPVTTHDEIGELASAFNQMTQNLRLLASEAGNVSQQMVSSSAGISKAAEEISIVSQEVTKTVQSLAAGATSQADNTTAAFKNIESLSSLVKEVAAHASSADLSAKHSAEVAAGGEMALQSVVSQIQQISATVDTSAGVVAELERHSQEINKIVEVISNIASQTNLLALNASIEAARAGEQGRGFAVVADEVRKLAVGSEQAAVQIRELLEEMSGQIEKANDSMNLGTQEVSKGIDVVREANKAFGEIKQVVEEVLARIEQISSAAGKMVEHSKGIVSEMQAIARVASEAAASSEEVSAASEEQAASVSEIANAAGSLVEKAQELRNILARFKF